MKLLLALFSVLTISSAHASYMATHCSNSSASVKWETGHNSNNMTIESYDTDVRVNTVSYFDLEVAFSNETVIREERKSGCGFQSYTRVFVAKAVITPAEFSPTALDFIPGDKKIETEVICTSNINSQGPCPE